MTDATFDAVWRSAYSRALRINFQREGGTSSCKECFFRIMYKPTVIHQVPLRSLPDDIEMEMPQSVDLFLEDYFAKSFSQKTV